MKLFVVDKTTNQKVNLNLLASTRGELVRLIGSPWFTFNGHNYHVNNVFAVADSNDTITGAIVGGVIGLLAGPIGIIAGGLLGGAIGNGGDKTEISNVDNFNSSKV